MITEPTEKSVQNSIRDKIEEGKESYRYMFGKKVYREGIEYTIIGLQEVGNATTIGYLYSSFRFDFILAKGFRNEDILVVSGLELSKLLEIGED